MLCGLIFGLYQNRTTPMAFVGNNLVIWILLALLGWGIFGAAAHR